MDKDTALDQHDSDRRLALTFASTVPGYFSPDQLAVLADFTEGAITRSRGPILEIGSYCGRSTVIIGTMAQRHHRRFITVDRHLGSIEMQPPFPYFDPAIIDRVHGRLDSISVLMDTLELAGLREWVTVMVTPSQVLTHLLRPGFSMIMIDGGHDALSTWTDYLCAIALLADDGTLVIDDVFEDPSRGGRPPFEVMTAALHSGFTLVERSGPLVALRRTTAPSFAR
ncbi:class I SAM-dependent methyltransferase [Ferrimicrobium sp.]|uniref:class I SAM-dependent methyltransferase n=1 Tax=Ferrimicrobium sp. TaxID=2926050 RepID=UPI0026058D4B|nr:class I SAM-dependent methyltransferase [Ferrimicrobium sp.]